MRGEVPTIRSAVPKPRGDAEWFAQSVEYYADNDAAQSGTIGSGQETWMQTTVVGPGNVSFRYKMSSVSGDALAFYVDEGVVASWSQGSTWPWTGNFAVPSGTHTLKWKYYKYSGSTAGSAWVDAIQWSGGVPGSGGGADWEQITYTYDPSGRRIAKNVDGEVTKYLYDGDQCIAEYDGDDTLLRTYIYGPGIDQPICMIEVQDANAAYFYHYDALGSVVALSDADGDTVQVYEYDVYGQVAASDPNHPNRFMFTGREFDKDTGLYYYRARYYNPTIGRFLQTDPIGYRGDINLYRYCRNNPWNLLDPFGTHAGAGLDWSKAYGPNSVNDPNLGDWHRRRNANNQALPTNQDAANSPWWQPEDNPYHWPDTYRGSGPYRGSQASYYPDANDPCLSDPNYAQYFDPNKAGQLDDETPLMGTFDYCPPTIPYWGDPVAAIGHAIVDVATHEMDPNYVPGLTTIIDPNSEPNYPQEPNNWPPPYWLN